MSAENISVVVDTEVLTKVFLTMLNRENLINNKTYLATLEKLQSEKEERENVNS